MYQIRPSGWGGLPVVVKNLLIINVLLFAAQWYFDNRGPVSLTLNASMYYYKSPEFSPYQLITYMFLHGSLPHIFFNMLGLYFFGPVLEQRWGANRFLFFYIACGLGAAVVQQFSLHYDYNRLVHVGKLFVAEQSLYMPTLGASGAIFGLLAAFGYLFPNQMIYIYFFVPMRAKWFVLLYAGSELLMGLGRMQTGVAHWAHLGGALTGFIIVLLWNKTNRRSFY
jgi:membrane associated rhomboid family serine protease